MKKEVFIEVKPSLLFDTRQAVASLRPHGSLRSAPDLPLAPGCYMFLDSEGTVLYVGKSKCLKKRVASYFGKVQQEKLNVMLRFADSILIEETETDIEALLLEHKLIKKFRPQYNDKMRKDYQDWYIIIDDGITITLDARLPGFIIGPFSHREAAVDVVDVLGKCFKLPTCGKTARQIVRMCLRGHMDNCFAPCDNKLSGADYYQNAIRFLQGGQRDILDGIQKKMQAAVGKMEFEKAAEFKAQHDGLKWLSSFVANMVPILAKKRFVVYLKSHHEDCFMLVFLDDGECLAKTVVLNSNEIGKINDFAEEVIAFYRQPTRDLSDESKAFVRALVEIGAIRRFYEVDIEVTSAMALSYYIKQSLFTSHCEESIKEMIK